MLLSVLFLQENKTKIPEVTEFQRNLIRVTSPNPESAGPDVYKRINIPNEASHQFSPRCLNDDMFGGEKNLSIGICIPGHFRP